MIYFDNAATSFPKPKEVVEAVNDTIINYGVNPGRSGHRLALELDRRIFDAREKLTDFIGGNNPMNLVFTSSCTDSLNTAIYGLAEKFYQRKEKCHVITTVLEHNSVLRPLKYLEQIGKISLTIVDADKYGIVNPEDIGKAITEDTKFCVTTAMSNLIGTTVDIVKVGEILKQKDIIYIVDAAQGLGYVDIDMDNMPIDILCFPGHKGILGLTGTGGLYFKDGIEIEPFRRGGTGSFSLELEQPEVSPDKFESGTLNAAGVESMAAGVEYINNIGLKNIQKHEDILKDEFIKGLKDIENIKLYGSLDDRQGPVVSLNIDGIDSSELAFKLSYDHDICTRAGFHCAPLAHRLLGTDKKGAVRFSFSYFNTLEEIKETIEILKSYAREA